MVFGTSRRREKVERIEAAAEALIRDLGDGAYHEALGREHEASSDALAKDWANVARAVARQTGSRIGFDLSTQLAMNTFFVLDREPGEPRKPQFRKPEPEHQADRNDVPRPQPFRIQFIGATPNFRTFDIEGSRDSCVRCVRCNHRRLNGSVAAQNDRIAHP